MAKRLKLRLSRVIPSFQFCRSKHPSNLPESPLPAICRFSPVNPKSFDIGYPNVPDPPPSTPHHPSFQRHLSSKIVSIGCGCRSSSCRQYVPEYKWRKEDKWHVVARVREENRRRKIYNSSVSGDSDSEISPILPRKTEEKKKKNKQRNKRNPSISNSSVDSGWFTSEDGYENEETEILVSSSRSFSNDSSYDFNYPLETINEKSINGGSRKENNNPKKARRLKRYVSKNNRKGVLVTRKTKTTPSTETESPGRVSVFRRMIPCKADGKMRESFAVVKRSEDPYEDFKRSMLEMILEKQIFEAKDLEELLHCFLSLNSRHHHEVIVEAFSEIWEVLFCKSPMNQRVALSL